MCLVGFDWRPGAAAPLLVLANRDEYYDRPAEPLAWWPGGRILAGRDLRAGGTWMGVARNGRFAVVTNVRGPWPRKPDAPSRGTLPARFLEGSQSASAFLEVLRREAGQFDPFNLLVYDGEDLLGFQSRDGRVIAFPPGLHAFSNGDFEAPWPKVEALVAGMAGACGDDEALLALLRDPRPWEDARLPRTGVPLEWERTLSPAFIRTPAYGTRTSTLLRLEREEASVIELRFSPEGPEGRTEQAFRLG